MKFVLFALVVLGGAGFFFKDEIFSLAGMKRGDPNVFDKDGEVYVLNEANFDPFLAKEEYVLVKFVAPWCGHCKNLAPAYQSAAVSLSKSNPSIKLATVDATIDKSLATRFSVRGYPTLKFFRNGAESDYTGGRTESDILRWVVKKSGPVAVDLSGSAKALEDFKTNNDVAVVGRFGDDDTEEKEVFLSAAGKDDDNVYGIINDAEKASITVYKHFDEKKNEFDGSFKADEIAAFVTVASTPLVMEFNEKNQKKIFAPQVKDKALLLIDSKAEGSDAKQDAFRAVASKNKGKAVFAWVDGDKKQILDFFGVSTGDLPALFVLSVDGSKMAKYRHSEGEITEKDMGAFFDKFFAGKVEKYVKSEPVPEKNDADVFVVVGKNFKDVVGGDKDVLIKFYAPWCGHCKALAPEYEKLGNKFADVDSVVIAKADATANDFPELELRGYPTLLFFPAGSATPINFEGDRTAKGFIKFIKANAKTEFELKKKKAPKTTKEEDKKDDL